MSLIIPPYNKKTKNKKQGLPRSQGLYDIKIPKSFPSKLLTLRHYVNFIVKIQVIQNQLRTDLLTQSKMYDCAVISMI